MNVNDLDINALLIKELPVELITIKHFYLQKKYTAMKQSVHRLHGVLCYANFPTLRSIISALEKALIAKNIPEIDRLFVKCEHEMLQLCDPFR